MSASMTFVTVISLRGSGSHFENAQFPVPYRGDNSVSVADLVLRPEFSSKEKHLSCTQS